MAPWISPQVLQPLGSVEMSKLLVVQAMAQMLAEPLTSTVVPVERLVLVDPLKSTVEPERLLVPVAMSRSSVELTEHPVVAVI